VRSGCFHIRQESFTNTGMAQHLKATIKDATATPYPIEPAKSYLPVLASIGSHQRHERL
jgi:hypothetical protein